MLHSASRELTAPHLAPDNLMRFGFRVEGLKERIRALIHKLQDPIPATLNPIKPMNTPAEVRIRPCKSISKAYENSCQPLHRNTLNA